MKGIEAAIKASDIPIETHVEYLDNLRKPSIQIESEQEALFKKKFGHISMKAILTTNDVALDFILKNRNTLFPDIPVVFCGPNDFKASRIAGQKKITGVAQAVDVRGSLDLILTLHPGTSRICVISDQRPSTKKSLIELNRIIPEYENLVDIVMLTDKSLMQLKKEIGEQPKGTVILFFSFLLDQHGKQYDSNLKILNELTGEFKLPFYTFKKIDVGNGAVGGKVVSEELMAQLSMEMVTKIIKGVPVNDIPILYKAPAVAMFDYHQLKKFKINESSLPQSSVIINKPSSFYYEYKDLVWAASIFGVLSVVLITFLSINVRKRILLEKKLRKHSDKLEGVVKERTAELVKTNTSLQQEVFDRKLAEKAIKESEKKYRALIETTDTGFVFVDEKGRVLEANQTYVKMTGHSDLKDIIGRSVLEWTAPYDIERNLIEVQKCFNTGAVQNLEIDYIHPDGKIAPIEIFAKTIDTKEGQTIITLCRDIFERKLAEEEKIEAQQNAMVQEKHALVGQIAGKMAHDFNNILSVIMGNTELSLLDCKDEQIRTTLELILGQTLRGKNLTKNLVAFAKGQEPKQTYFKINEKIDLVISLLKKDLEGIQLVREDTDGAPELLADPGMIEHAMVNLVQNSIHALSKTEMPKIIIRTYCLDHQICFDIEDNGCGIPAEHLDAIYQPSFTLKGSKDLTGLYKKDIKGTGYGMANVKKYIEQHKGAISVVSQIGVGTKFTICLPMIKKELTSEEIIEIRKSTIQREKCILLVEDEASISDVQYRILTREPFNHKVDTAFDGQSAMALFDTKDYDFISLDYELPGKFNGMDVYSHIRKTDRHTPILFISGNIEFLESIRDLKKNDAFIDHLSKPCQNKDYVNAANHLIEKAITLTQR